ncbi:MAG: hypothetical protein AAGB15_05770 [Pseudomonadota bacterium]
MDDRAAEDRRNRRTRDRSLVLLVIGLVLLMPPVAGIFHIDARVFGVPATLLYLFAVWALLIVIARSLAGALAAPTDPPADRP